MEKHLKYIRSIVLGLNDALVELTGALAGFTFALQNTRLIAATGLITGIAAALSMAASEYLSTKSEGHHNPPGASLYTGIAYFVTVLILVFPYFLLKNHYHALAVTILNAIVVIFVFTYVASGLQKTPFLKRFLEMACISLGVAAFTFGIGFLLRTFWQIGI